MKICKILKYISLTLLVNCIMYSIAFGASPNTSFMNTKFINNNATLNEFIAEGILRGVWKPTKNNNSWLYEVAYTDEVTNKKRSLKLLFAKNNQYLPVSFLHDIFYVLTV